MQKVCHKTKDYKDEINPDPLPTKINITLKIFEVTDVNASNLKKELADVSGIVLRTAQMPNEVIDACPKLQIIARHGVGYDNVDLNYLNIKLKL